MLSALCNDLFLTCGHLNKNQTQRELLVLITKCKYIWPLKWKQTRGQQNIILIGANMLYSPDSHHPHCLVFLHIDMKDCTKYSRSSKTFLEWFTKVAD